MNGLLGEQAKYLAKDGRSKSTCSPINEQQDRDTNVSKPSTCPLQSNIAKIPSSLSCLTYFTIQWSHWLGQVADIVELAIAKNLIELIKKQ